MRVHQRLYHLDCFRCTVCDRILSPGDRIHVTPQRLLCEVDASVMGVSEGAAKGKEVRKVPTDAPLAEKNGGEAVEESDAENEKEEDRMCHFVELFAFFRIHRYLDSIQIYNTFAYLKLHHICSIFIIHFV